MDPEAREYEKIEGTVERIIYSNSENGYCVCELLSFSDELVTAVGIMPYLAEGETVEVFGNWTVHPSFGRQFKVEGYEKQLPVTESAILKYLASGAIRGVGPVTARKIVEKYGEETFDIIENNPEWLSDIGGISPKKAKEIGENYKAQFGMKSVMIFCREFFGPSTAVKIYKKWGSASVDIIKKNPYMLCREIPGIGFERADEVARGIGFSQESPERIAAGIKYVLSFNQFQNGHVYLPKDKLVESAGSLLDCGEEKTMEALVSLVHTGELVRVKYDGTSCIYTKEAYEAEKYTAYKLDLLENTNHSVEAGNCDELIKKAELDNGIHYERQQRKSITEAVNNSVFILTGGPGTGKTTVVKAIIGIFKSMGCRVALAAPTGRAAKRMSQAAGVEAKTIHRMLEMEYGSDDELVFRRDENNLLEEDVLIIDEASMIDIFLMQALLKATKASARLILIGDANQLPPVGAGYVLHDILRSERYNSVELTHIFRQAEKSLIVENAHMVNNGEHIDLGERGNDFFFLPRNDDEATAKTVAELCGARLPKKYGVTVFDSIQVITPSRKGAAGTEMLNSVLQARINPPSPLKKEKKVGHTVFREGDKIMQNRNNYDIVWIKDGKDGLGMFNGDIGVIKKIDNSRELVTIDFDDKLTEYDYGMLDDVELAYAITVHKSQGSEYPIVIIPLYTFTPLLLTRNLLYTALTRAQNMVILVGNGDVVQRMIDNNRQTKRYTGLEKLLRRYE